MGLIALVTSTGNANSTQLRLVQFHALPVPVTRAINPHIALSTVLLTILTILSIVLLTINYTNQMKLVAGIIIQHRCMCT